MGEKSEFDPAADAIRVRSIVDVLKKEKENHREAGEYMRLFGDSREGWEIGFSAKNNLIFSNGSRKGHNLAETVTFELKDGEFVCDYSNDIMVHEGASLFDWLAKKEWSAFAKLTADQLSTKVKR